MVKRTDVISNSIEFHDFITESNRIEGINRAPLQGEIDAHRKFLLLPQVTIKDLQGFVSVCQPGAALREKGGMDVCVGAYPCPSGGPGIKTRLQAIVDDANGGDLSAYQAHVEYELLHPFTDGNGRSGRMLWLWMVGGRAPLGFLHTFYYQSLSAARLVPNYKLLSKVPS